MMKADKLAMDKVYEYADATFEVKGKQIKQDTHLQDQIDSATNTIKEMKERLKVDIEKIKKKTQVQIHNATHHLKTSYFDDQ